MQTEMDAERIRELGLAPDRVFVSGNVKFDAGEDTNQKALTSILRERFQFDDERPLIVAASTHPPEEKILLEAFKQIRSTRGKVRLLLAPRHPERFGEISQLLESCGFSWSKRSADSSASDSASDIILLDSIGELRAIYPLAKLVFMGGSLAPTGGHNILEPAAARVCTVTGAHTFNFKAIVEDFLQSDALVQLPIVSERDAPSALSKVLVRLLADEDRRRVIAENARAVLEKNRGATALTIKLLAQLLTSASNQSEDREAEGARADFRAEA